MKKIVLASGNPGKIREFNKLLSTCGIEVLPQSEFGVSNIEETGLTFAENAILKARHASEITGLPAIADDSGIEVDALEGAPGIYSARFSGEDANDEKNNLKLLNELKGKPTKDRTARYQCILVFMRNAKDPTPMIFQSAWEGVILESPKGEGGFGYDPIFYVPTHHCSAAELAPDIKNVISHRGKAMRLLQEGLNLN